MSGPQPFFDWAACGTPAQYRKHLRHGIPMCESCRQAENRRQVDGRRRRGAPQVQAVRRVRSRTVRSSNFADDFANMIRAVDWRLNFQRKML